MGGRTTSQRRHPTCGALAHAAASEHDVQMRVSVGELNETYGSYATVEDWVSHVGESEHWYEIVPRNRARWFYLDLDWDMDQIVRNLGAPTEEPEATVMKVVDRVQRLADTMYEEEVPRGGADRLCDRELRYQQVEGGEEGVVPCGVQVRVRGPGTEHSARPARMEDPERRAIIIDDLEQPGQEDRKWTVEPVMDKSPYGSNQSKRMLGSRKWGREKPRPGPEGGDGFVGACGGPHGGDVLSGSARICSNSADGGGASSHADCSQGSSQAFPGDRRGGRRPLLRRTG